MDREDREWKIKLEFQCFLESEFDEYYVLVNPEIAPESNLEEVTEVKDADENVVDIVPNIQSNSNQYTIMKNETRNAKSKIQNYETKEMRAFEPESKSRKRKRVYPYPKRVYPTSELVKNFSRTLNRNNRSFFNGMKKFMRDKYGIDAKLFKDYLGKFVEEHVGNRLAQKIDKRRRKRRNRKK